MKKFSLLLIILLIFSTGCKKEDSRLSFSLKNLTTLLGKTSEYISNASPGEIYKDEDDYLYFFLEDIIDGIDEVYVYYNLDSYEECDYINIVLNSRNSLSDADTLLNLAEDEFSTAEYYYLSYYDDSTVLKEYLYDTKSELQTSKDTAGVSLNNIDQVFGLYHYDKYYILAGGYYSDTYNCFFSLIEIGFYNDLSKSGKGVLFNDIREPYRKWRK
jgi:hypothetical protein